MVKRGYSSSVTSSSTSVLVVVFLRTPLMSRRTSISGFTTCAFSQSSKVCWVAARSSQDAFIGTTTRSLQSIDRKHTSELQSLMRISYAVFCLKKKKKKYKQKINRDKNQKHKKR